MVAHSPRRSALVLDIGHLVGLAVDACLHDVILANGAVVDCDVPGPESHGIPLFHFKSICLLLYCLYHSKCKFIDLLLV